MRRVFLAGSLQRAVVNKLMKLSFPTFTQDSRFHHIPCRGFLFIAILLNCLNLSGQNFQPGRYYTQKNERINGLLSHRVYKSKKDEPSNLILFKKDKDSKEVEITIHQAKAFVVDEDSFAIVHGFFSNGYHYNQGRYFTEDFAKVTKKGRINLYIHYCDVTAVSSGVGTGFVPYVIPHEKTVKTYLIGKAGGYTISAINQNNFKDRMESLLFDDAEMLEKLKMRKYKFKDLEKLIDDYNFRWENKK